MLKVAWTRARPLLRLSMFLLMWTRMEIHISEGLKFPFLPLIHQCLHFTRLYPIHVHVNIIHVMLGVCVLNKKYEVRLGLEEVLYSYSLKHHNLGRYSLVADNKALQLVTNLPATNKNKPQGNVLLFGAWGCAYDPKLVWMTLRSRASFPICSFTIWRKCIR